ncbi:MAG: GntR family transcriptional regulator [Victivallales bacterium]|jgi:DNA-binding LacI/PurR family transcriptional regulator
MIDEVKNIEMITKFEQFSDHLEDSIKKGKFKTGQKIPSERDFAKKFGMSHMTVNKAVAGLVARNLLRRVQGDGTYVAEVQKTLISETVISIIETKQESHAQFISVLPEMLVHENYMPSIYELNSSIKAKAKIRKLIQDVPKAVIVDGTGLVPYDILDDVSPETHLVFINRFEGKKKYDASCILSDYVSGGYMAVRHLLGLGRKKILIMTYEIKPGWTSELFMKGCRKALAEAGLEPAAVSIKDAPGAEDELEKMFSSGKRPDGVVSLADYLLAPMVECASRHRLRIPEDVALVGYYNTPWAEALNLTSLSIRADFISQKAVEAIEKGKKIRLNVKPEFVFRKSCPSK